MPNWMQRWFAEQNYPGGGEPAPTPSFPQIVQDAFPEKPSIEKPPTIPTDLLPDLKIQDTGYPAVVPVKPSDNQLQYKPADRGGAVILPQTPVSDAVLGKNYPAGQPAVNYRPISDDPRDVVQSFDPNDPRVAPQPVNLPTPPTVSQPTQTSPVWQTAVQPQSTSALDITKAANANAALDTSMTFRGTDYAPRAELVKMPPYQTPGIPSQMVSPEQPEVRRAELVRLPDLIQKGQPPSEMVTPYTTPPVSQQQQPQVRPAIPVVGTTSAAGAPRAQLVQAHPYDLSTYNPEQVKTFLDKIKNLGSNDVIPTSVYESVVPIPKAQLVSMGTPATRAAVAAAAKVSAPAPVLTNPTATPSGVLRGLAYGPTSEGATAADQRQTHGPLGQLQKGDIAVSPNLLNQYPLGSRVHVVDRNGKIVFPNRRVADTSWYSAGRPTTNTFELWNGPSLGQGYRLVRA